MPMIPTTIDVPAPEGGKADELFYSWQITHDGTTTKGTGHAATLLTVLAETMDAAHRSTAAPYVLVEITAEPF